MKKLTGTGVALVTPFLENGELDIPSLRKLVRHVSQPGGVDFLVALGTTAESVTLESAEQDEVIRTIMDENAGKLPVVIGCGGNNTTKVISQMKYLTSTYHPDGFLSVCPYYNKPTQEGLYLHFKAIAQAATIPIILYNVPARTSSNLLPATANRIAKEFPQYVAVKEASGSVEQCMEIVAGKPATLDLLSGDDALTMPIIAIGGKGVISVAANALPLEFSAISRLMLEGKLEAAKNMHYRIFNLMNLNFREGNPAGIKAMLSVLGICGRTVRLPLAAASDALRDEMKKSLADAGIASLIPS